MDARKVILLGGGCAGTLMGIQVLKLARTAETPQERFSLGLLAAGGLLTGISGFCLAALPEGNGGGGGFDGPVPIDGPVGGDELDEPHADDVEIDAVDDDALATMMGEAEAQLETEREQARAEIS